MLSPQAWNAFLKTLEEPPPRTIFVLATTEAQKVLPTVVDRCHRFDFGRPSVEQVATVLRRVAAQEQIDIEDGALALVARHATGQLPRRARHARAAPHLRRRRADRLRRRARRARCRRRRAAVRRARRGASRAIRPQALRAAAALAESGRDPGQVLRDLEVHGRELLTVQVLGEVPAELRVTPERDAPPARAGPGAVARPTPSGCSTSSPRRWRRRPTARRPRIQLELAAGQGRRARARSLDDRAAGADRAARGRERRTGARRAAPRLPAAAAGSGCRPAVPARHPPPATAAPRPASGPGPPPPAPSPRPPPRAPPTGPGRRRPAGAARPATAAAAAWPAVVEIVRGARTRCSRRCSEAPARSALDRA